MAMPPIGQVVQELSSYAGAPERSPQDRVFGNALLAIVMLLGEILQELKKRN